MVPRGQARWPSYIASSKMTSELLPALGFCLAGLAALVIGAEMLVRGGSALARLLRVSPAVIGLTVIALGTSAPELAVGVDASLKGNGALAVGNIAGTNTVNILLVLGLSAVIKPLSLRQQTLKLDLPAMLVAAIALFVLARDGVLSRVDGLILIALGATYSCLLFRTALRERAAAKATGGDEERRETGAGRTGYAILRDLTRLFGGILVVVLGADWLVNGGIAIAGIWGVSDAFIGLTIVAIGTSAPELVTTIVSTLRGKREIAIGNLLGSSTYNIAFILGITCLVPADGLPAPDEVAMIDIPVMMAAVIACVPVFLIGRHVSRLEGSLFVASYALYLGYLLVART